MGFIYEIYIDVLALNNFFVDLAAFLAVNLFLRRRIRAHRILAGALAGTIISCVVFTVCRNLAVYMLIVHFIINPAVLYLIFREKNKKDFFTDLFVGYFTFLIVGGIIEWMYAGGRGILSYETAAAAAVFVLLAAVLWTRRYLKNRTRDLGVSICLNKKSVRLRALSDSGCLLHDPYIGKPVSMIDRSVFEANYGTPKAVRLIPYESLGCRHGLLCAVTIDEIKFVYGNEEKCVKQAVLGLADRELFEKKSYQMIINPEELSKSENDS